MGGGSEFEERFDFKIRSRSLDPNVDRKLCVKKKVNEI